VFTTIASAPFSVSLNRTYRLRLEAIGTRLRVHLDGRLLLEATDTSLKRGLAGLQMFRTAASFDNIIVSPNPQVALYATDFETWDDRFTKTGDGTWELATDGTRVLRQTSTTTPTGGRAIAGVATADQSVQTRVKATAFDTAGNPWFGLITRYQDDSNYYYVTVRKANTLSLRRLVNGAVQELDVAPMTVSTGQWYTLRMESIDDAIRVYVNGELRLEAKDSTFARGRYGLMAYRTAASFDDVLITEP